MEECIEFMNKFEVEISLIEGLIAKTDDIKLKKILQKDIKRKKKNLIRYSTILERVSSDEICCRIYAKILRGKSPTKAVEEVANENFFNNVKPFSITTIWRHYSRLKEVIE